MLVGAAVIYGAMFSVNKIAASGGAPPLAYAFWQSFGAGLALWILLTLRGGRFGVSRQALTSYLVIGALVISVPIALLTYIAPKLPAGIMTLVLALSPPFSFIIGVAARVERFRWLGLLGLLFGFDQNVDRAEMLDRLRDHTLISGTFEQSALTASASPPAAAICFTTASAATAFL